MSALDGFISVWSSARNTFGSAPPQDGGRFDASARLRRFRDDVRAAAPNSDWTGAAADTYADANSRQAGTLGAMADLDARLAVEVDRSAAVVTAGRRDLDAVRQWVIDAAGSVPDTAARERMLWPVVAKGVGEIADIVKRSHDDLSAIAERIRGLHAEYDDLAGTDGAT